jgi:hypothetical protein
MEPEGSLPHSQVPATCLYPEPAQSSPYPHIPLPEVPSQYYPPIYAWVSLAQISSHQASYIKKLHHTEHKTILEEARKSRKAGSNALNKYICAKILHVL